MTSRSLLLPFIAILTVTIANAQQSFEEQVDPIAPGAGASTLLVVTGIPFATAVEYSIGIDDRLTLGGMVGLAWGDIWGFGVRPRMVLAELENGPRLVARMPMLYYPPAGDDEAWGLVWPQIDAHWNAGGVDISAGAGLVGSACIDALFGTGNHAEHRSHAGAHGFHHESTSLEEMEHEVMGGICPTLQAAVAVPISSRVTFHLDSHVMLDGIDIVGKGWISDVPYVVAIGASWGL